MFHLAVNAFTILLLVGSLLFLFDRRDYLLGYWVLWGPWLALTVFHVLTYAEARYLFPSRPGLVLMASAALVPRVQALFSFSCGTSGTKGHEEVSLSRTRGVTS
jgi:hypothetical protein